MHIIIFFQSNGHSFNKFLDIDIMSKVFIAIFKYDGIFTFVESKIILFNQRSNFMSTLKNDKFFNLFDIIVTINTLCIREDKISLSLNSHTYCKNLEVITTKYYAHAPRGIDW